ncbi:GrpB family protein [Nannocystis punicea]|uniref:GrpB family protein n=1 Tax=Nannocystis punicea TaxID=2995304 RepID=A0ABY7H7U1_9BACT|nr:GrpB family protein [Nannocystis poenicansa]WAS95337.1 GrpB family protein [Nannocystis poenicansa]
MIVNDYRSEWPSEFRELGRRVRSAVGGAALRIDHIGSTAVPGLGAKDVIDVQITVADLDAASDVTGPLKAAGFRQGESFVSDLFHGLPEGGSELRKLYMREPEGERRTHLHIRELGRFNQRYALLFRDFLRASDVVRSEYELLKRRAAQLFPESIDGYLWVKEPIFHIIYEAASLWADRTGWSPAADHL